MKVSNLTFSTKAGRNIVDRVSFELPSRGFFAVYGPSGSGKSTLLALLSGQLKPTGGSIEFEGRRIGRGRKAEDYLLSDVGLLPQSFHLLEDRTALFNVALPLRIAGERKKKAEEKARHLMESLGLRNVIDSRCSLLSGGEKARVALARALVKDPKILFCDEPSGALDEESGLKLMRILREESRKRLVVMVSHDEPLSSSFIDGFLRLSDGRISENRIPRVSSSEASVKKRRKRGGSYLFSFLSKAYWVDKGKLTISFLSGLVCSLLVLFVSAFYLGSQEAVNTESELTLSYLAMDFSISEEIETGGFVNMTRSRRPNLEEVDELLEGEEGVSYAIDLSYYLPSLCPITVNGFPFDETSLFPIRGFSYMEDASWDGRIEGETLSGNPLSYCVVNKAFEKLLDGSAVGRTIGIRRQIRIEEGEFAEDFEVNLSFVASSVVDEFSFMETPRIYYSYDALAGYLKNIEFASLAGNPYTYVEEASSSSTVSSYQGKLFVDRPETARKLSAKAAEIEGYSLSSEAILSSDSFEELSSAFLMLMEPFLVLIVISSAFVMGTLSYASFLSRRREFAILSSLGARKRDLISLYTFPCLTVSFVACSLVNLLSPWMLLMGRGYLYRSVGIGLLLPILPNAVLLFSLTIQLVVSLLGCLLPLIKGSMKNLHEELMEE